jgi:hypothetical protein
MIIVYMGRHGVKDYLWSAQKIMFDGASIAELSHRDMSPNLTKGRKQLG